MDINPIPENEVGSVEVPDNGLTPEQMALINEQVRLGEQLTQPPAEPSAEGTVQQPEPTPSATAEAEPEQPEPEEPKEEQQGLQSIADLPNYLDKLDLDNDGEVDVPASTRAGLAMGFGFVDGVLTW